MATPKKFSTQKMSKTTERTYKAKAAGTPKATVSKKTTVKRVPGNKAS